MIEERACPRCGRTIYQAAPRRPGRPKTWCSAACRRAAADERRAAASGIIRTTYVTVEVSLDEHTNVVLGSPAACRRVLRELAEMERVGTLDGAKWSSVAGELERLRRVRGRPSRGC